MRIRGDIFWKWSDPTLHHRTHDETQDDGTTMDIQSAVIANGTQMFIGVYAGSGMALHEEADTRPGESMTRAAWGLAVRGASLPSAPSLRNGLLEQNAETVGRTLSQRSTA